MSREACLHPGETPGRGSCAHTRLPPPPPPVRPGYRRGHRWPQGPRQVGSGHHAPGRCRLLGDQGVWALGALVIAFCSLGLGCRQPWPGGHLSRPRPELGGLRLLPWGGGPGRQAAPMARGGAQESGGLGAGHLRACTCGGHRPSWGSRGLSDAVKGRATNRRPSSGPPARAALPSPPPLLSVTQACTSRSSSEGALPVVWGHLGVLEGSVGPSAGGRARREVAGFSPEGEPCPWLPPQPLLTPQPAGPAVPQTALLPACAPPLSALPRSP